MLIKSKANVIHGDYAMAEGDELEIPDVIAEELIKAGFVEQSKRKMAPAHENKMQPDPSNKVAKAKTKGE